MGYIHKDNWIPFHQQLKLERKRLGWSQSDLAEVMGKISVKTFRRWKKEQSTTQDLLREYGPLATIWTEVVPCPRVRHLRGLLDLQMTDE